jgi:rRNA maturation endonuclease Nob1
MSYLDPYTVFTIILVIILIVYMFMETKRKPARIEYVTRELLVCYSCGFQVERDHEPGDFIGLVKGKCPRCGGDLKIKGIYSVDKSKILKAS